MRPLVRSLFAMVFIGGILVGSSGFVFAAEWAAGAGLLVSSQAPVRNGTSELYSGAGGARGGHDFRRR